MALLVGTGAFTSRTARGAFTTGVGGRSLIWVIGDSNWYTTLRVTCRFGATACNIIHNNAICTPPTITSTGRDTRSCCNTGLDRGSIISRSAYAEGRAVNELVRDQSLIGRNHTVTRVCCIRIATRQERVFCKKDRRRRRTADCSGLNAQAKGLTTALA